MFEAYDLIFNCNNIDAICNLFRTHIVMISYSERCNNAGVHPMGVMEGWRGSEHVQVQCTGFARDGHTPMDIVTIMNHNIPYPPLPLFDAYWCPYESNQLRQTTLGGDAEYMFTAKMDGCTFGVGTAVLGGHVTVGHVNIGGDGQAQMDLLRGSASFGVNGSGLTGYLGPGTYRYKDSQGHLKSQATTFGMRDPMGNWRFFAQICTVTTLGDGGPRRVQLVNLVNVA
jgi:hypothetical protein